MKKSIFLLFTILLIISRASALEGLWYYTETPPARESLFKNISKINVLGPQTYELGMNGTIKSTMKEDVIELANSKGVKVMPLIANTNGKFFNQKTILNLLDNPSNWQKVSKYMRDEAYRYGFYGWQLDLENIPITHKDKFTNFVKYLKSEFDKDGLKLSIAVVSKISDDPSLYPTIYWKEWAGAYDYKALASSTDFLSIMTYDQPNSPGPVATIQWTKKVLDYTLQNVPKEKISLGIPVYSWAYRGNERNHFTMVDFPVVYSKLVDFKKNDPKNMTTGAGTSKTWGDISWVSYNMYGKNYTIWYEDRNSFKAKFDQINASGVRGYSVWVLGSEDPSIWQIL